jgi:hypothetical protein
MKDKIEIIIRHTSAGQTQQFYGVNHYDSEEALRRFHAISAEADKMHWRLLQDSEMEPSPMPDLLEALKRLCDLPCNCPCEVGGDEMTAYGKARAAIAKAEGRGE